MYSNSSVGLGQVTKSAPKPTLSQNLFAALDKGLTTGLTIFDKVTQLKQTVETRKQAEQMARMVAMQPPMMMPVRQPMFAGIGMDWTTLVMVGIGGVIVLGFMFRPTTTIIRKEGT